MTESQLDALLEYIDRRIQESRWPIPPDFKIAQTEDALRVLRYEFLNDKALAEGK